MKTAKMTIRLPDSDLVFAKRYAQEQGLSLTSLILRYLERLAHAGKSDVPNEVRAVAGVVPLQADAKAEYRERLIGKHA